MIARLRAFCREESLGIVLPVGFVLLFALWNLVEASSQAFVYPILTDLLEEDEQFARLDFTLGDVVFDWTFLGFELPAFIVLCGILYFVFIRPLPEGNEYIDESDDGMRSCPECFSEIVVEARRCPFCTAVIEPLTNSDGSAI
jgi:large conductance mechanosensitive channel